MKRKRKRLMVTRSGHRLPSPETIVTANPKSKTDDSSSSPLISSSSTCSSSSHLISSSSTYSSPSYSPSSCSLSQVGSTTVPTVTYHRPREQQLRPQRLRRRHVCLHCNRFFTFLPFFLCHLRMRHRPIHCKKCCKCFVFRSVYIRHTLLVHGSRLRRKSSSMDSDVDSLASSTSSTMTKGGVGRGASRTTSNIS